LKRADVVARHFGKHCAIVLYLESTCRSVLDLNQMGKSFSPRSES